jgi:COP9 signalosome complex subunit 2
VEGKIDQVGMRLELETKQSLEKKRYTALKNWTESLEAVHTAVVGKTASSANRGGGELGYPSSYLEDRW